MSSYSNILQRRTASLILIAAVLLFSQTVLTQSGRQKKPAPPPPTATPSPVTPAKDTTAVKTAPGAPSAATANEQKTDTPSEAEPIKPTLRILSVIVNAQSIIPDSSYWSNDVKYAVKDCMEALKERSRLKIVRGGMRNRGEAIRRAKMEKDAYVLWMELNMKNRLMKSPEVNFIEYFLFMPQTAKVVTQGKVDPKNIIQIAEGGTRVPRTVNKPPSTPDEQLTAGAREVADRVRGWF
jgi:hypothetical protein